jgi:energy-coupling factor transporter ATP-binding protein EcfA2
MSRFSKATRKKAKARVALVGPSGSGKTYTALVLARGLVGTEGTIALIDTERASASKYAGEVTEFDALDLDHHSPKEYVDAITDAAKAGYDVLVIDSLSHAWNGRGGALEQVDQASKRAQGNSYVAWRDVTPQHNALVDAILTYPGHVIVTMRAKTEYVLDEGKNGKKTPRKVGMAPIQREGMEYEFDVVADMDLDHNLIVSKSRCSALADAVVSRPDAAIAETLRAWLSDGADMPAPVAPTPSEAETWTATQAQLLSEATAQLVEDLQCEDTQHPDDREPVLVSARGKLQLWCEQSASEIARIYAAPGTQDHKRRLWGAVSRYAKAAGVEDATVKAWLAPKSPETTEAAA